MKTLYGNPIEDWSVKSGNLAVGLNGIFSVKLNSSTFD